MIQNEFDVLISDTNKRIIGDIFWEEDEDHSPSVEFHVEVEPEAGYPIFIRGSFNASALTLTYALIHRGSGRIYALDLGKDHHNPECRYVGEKHKHRWNESVRDKEAFVPADITAPVSDPVGVWKQFCQEAKIQHMGTMQRPPLQQLDLI